MIAYTGVLQRVGDKPNHQQGIIIVKGFTHKVATNWGDSDWDEDVAVMVVYGTRGEGGQ